MKSLFRSSAAALAAGYVLLSVLALVLFAVPLWLAWQRTVETGRAEILQADAQRLAEVFRRGGASGLKAFIDDRVGLQIPGERVLLLTDASFRPLAGNLPAWPGGIPREAGTYTVELNLQGHSTRAVVVHARLADGYNLLVGRDTARYAPVETHFWFGLAGAVGILLIAGVLGGVLIRRALLARIHGLQETVSAIVQGQLSRRLPVQKSGDELDELAQTINGMLEQIEHLINGVRNVSNSIAHDLRTPLTELRARLEELSLARPAPAETFTERSTRHWRMSIGSSRFSTRFCGSRRSTPVCVGRRSFHSTRLGLRLTPLSSTSRRRNRRASLCSSAAAVLSPCRGMPFCLHRR